MTRVGLAYSLYLSALLEQDADCIDYVEVPVELLLHNPSALDSINDTPFILHCATLNIAGTVLPSEEVVESIGSWVHRTRTPWVGEHLAFNTADRSAAG